MSQIDLFSPQSDVLPRLDPHVAHRLDHFIDCQLAIDALFLEATRSQNVLAAMVQFLSKAVAFSNLSIYNAMLVQVQRPGALAVASPAKWAAIGRHLKVGARPLLILKAFGPVEFVYEHGDTDGQPMDGAETNILLASGTPHTVSLEQMQKSVQGSGIVIQFDDKCGELSAGSAHAMNIRRGEVGTAQPRWTVLVNAKYDDPSKFATLAHELAHIYCGHLGAELRGAWPDRSRLGEHEREVEAEAAAWLVCRRNGVKTHSAAYLAEHLPHADSGAISLYAIFEAANRIESRTPRLQRGVARVAKRKPKPKPEGQS